MAGQKSCPPATYFYPRPPRGGRPKDSRWKTPRCLFLSTPSARRATAFRIFFFVFFIISIHALREEGDPRWATRPPSAEYFYPRPPRGGRPWKQALMLWQRVFLSTPSARRATLSKAPMVTSRQNFYPRPPRGGRRNAVNSVINFFKISIHALREEGDKTVAFNWVKQNNFYPRPPRGGRPAIQRGGGLLLRISIHALREEGDRELGRSVGGHIQISIHALREEGDPSFMPRWMSPR